MKRAEHDDDPTPAWCCVDEDDREPPPAGLSMRLAAPLGDDEPIDVGDDDG